MLSDFFIPFNLQSRTPAPDGFGDVIWTYADAVPFMAGISTNSSDEAQIAYRNGLKTIYTIVLRKNLTLRQEDVVKRVTDGKLFRITSNAVDMATPAKANESYWQVTAEVIE